MTLSPPRLPLPRRASSQRTFQNPPVPGITSPISGIVAEEAREQRGLQAEQFHWQCIRKLRTLSRLGLRYAIAHRAKETILTVAVHVRCDTITGVIRPGCEAET